MQAAMDGRPGGAEKPPNPAGSGRNGASPEGKLPVLSNWYAFEVRASQYNMMTLPP
jgi:hypothetical protein